MVEKLDEMNTEKKNIPHITEEYDVVVVGAGHAGCEAALASARLGLETIMFTVSVDSIALMPCNPNIGGSSKGHLVREIDALGGEMGKNIDKTYIQSKMLNKSKGPAVHSLRAQADKDAYSMTMRYTLQNTDNLTLRQAEVTELIVEDGVIKGVKTFSGAIYHAKTVVLATGTYLKARCLYGEVVNYTGPNGLQAANYLSQSLKDNGVELYRFKTGTPARIDKRSVNFDVMEEQFGDEKIVPFSFTNKEEDIKREQISCWLTYTNEETHKIIRDNLDRSPIYAGVIEGTGPRYCPSIEDKVVRFADKKRHQVFIEPEGLYTNEMYIGGMSSSLPEDVQDEPELAFFDELPTVWDDTKVLNGSIGEYVSIARKKDNRWFLGCITNNDARKMELPLDFLEGGKKYELTLYTDGGEKVKTRTHVAIQTKKVTSKTVLKLDMLPRGGCAMIIREMN